MSPTRSFRTIHLGDRKAGSSNISDRLEGRDVLPFALGLAELLAVCILGRACGRTSDGVAQEADLGRLVMSEEGVRTDGRRAQRLESGRWKIDSRIVVATA